MAEAGTLPKGTQPEGATSEQDASRKVREMFTRIAPRYDLLNHLLSGQMDKRWRTRTARELRPILERADAQVLDLCCGTGDLAFSLARNAKARIIGADFSHTMLVRAKAKAVAESNGSTPVPFFEADALRLPFADGSFDCVFVGYGLRNFPNLKAALREIERVTRPGGAIVSLDFFLPPNRVFRRGYLAYLYAQGALWGMLLHGRARTYTYIPDSIKSFVSIREFSGMLEQAGYGQVRARGFILGGIGLHSAVKR